MENRYVVLRARVFDRRPDRGSARDLWSRECGFADRVDSFLDRRHPDADSHGVRKTYAIALTAGNARPGRARSCFSDDRRTLGERRKTPSRTAWFELPGRDRIAVDTTSATN